VANVFHPSKQPSRAIEALAPPRTHHHPNGWESLRRRVVVPRHPARRSPGPPPLKEKEKSGAPSPGAVMRVRSSTSRRSTRLTALSVGKKEKRRKKMALDGYPSRRRGLGFLCRMAMRDGSCGWAGGVAELIPLGCMGRGAEVCVFPGRMRVVWGVISIRTPASKFWGKVASLCFGSLGRVSGVGRAVNVCWMAQVPGVRGLWADICAWFRAERRRVHKKAVS